MYSSLGQQALEYIQDAQQRSVLFWDVLRQSGDQYLDHAQAGSPPVLVFDHEVIVDGRELSEPVNYGLLRIIPPADMPTDVTARPFIIIDPRAGHGPGVAGSKIHSEIGVALAAGHPCYFVTFAPYPEPNQNLFSVLKAETHFLDVVLSRHDPQVAGKPFLIGNCQGGWALMLLAATSPEKIGPIMLAGAPLSYWAGKTGQNPMRYSGGMLGGSWLSSFAADVGDGLFDGAHLVTNFEMLDPANTFWKKPYHLYANIDTEPARYLDFDKWWTGHFMMTRQEIDWIVQNLFVGNRLAKGKISNPVGSGAIDLRNIRTPIVVFASQKDNITPPSQALNWIADLYETDQELLDNEQVIVYCLHETTGHLGIFVSSGIAGREHEALVGALELIELLPPGLYEVKIEDLHPETSYQEWVEGRHVVSFAPRSIKDLALLDDGRDDEVPFEVVEKVSEVNQQLYDATLAPLVRGFNTPLGGVISRELHPQRMGRYFWSSLNPLTAALVPAVAQIKRDRKPLDSKSNVFSVWEEVWGQSITNGLDLWRDTRDQSIELVFQSLYGSPWMRAAVGLEPKTTFMRPDNYTVTALKKELLALRSQLSLEQIDKGDVADGFARVLTYMVGRDTFIDERVFNLLKHLSKKEVNGFVMPDPFTLKDKLRKQWRILQTHPQEAIEALPVLIPTAELRATVWAAVAEVAELGDLLHLSPELEARFAEIACALHLCSAWQPTKVKKSVELAAVESTVQKESDQIKESLGLKTEKQPSIDQQKTGKHSAKTVKKTVTKKATSKKMAAKKSTT